MEGATHWIQIKFDVGTCWIDQRLRPKQIRSRPGNSGLDWTILRPSVMYDPGKRGVAARTIAAMKRLSILPIVVSGRDPLRPAYVNDEARAALDCLDEPGSIDKFDMIGGLMRSASRIS